MQKADFQFPLEQHDGHMAMKGGYYSDALEASAAGSVKVFGTIFIGAHQTSYIRAELFCCFHFKVPPYNWIAAVTLTSGMGGTVQ
jgi:hypothetical protein